jgi:hypothetical protein
MAKRPPHYEGSEPPRHRDPAAATIAARSKRKPTPPLTLPELARQVAEVSVHSPQPNDAALSPLTAEEEAMQREIDRIIARLDAEIPEAHRTMDALLSRLRTTRILVAA